MGTCTGKAKNCKIGQILNADASCSDYRVNGVEPIGIVAYISPDGCGQALALDRQAGKIWSNEYVDIPGLTNHMDTPPITDFNSCQNTKIILDYSYKEYGDSAPNYYPAAWAANNFYPSTAPETKGKWCLPAVGVLDSIRQNKDTIEKSLVRISKPNISDDSWWSSSERYQYDAWYWRGSTNTIYTGYDGSSYGNKNAYNHTVRPIIEF